MTLNYLLENLPSWMAQTLVLAAIGAALPKIFRIQHPRTQLLYGHALLAACLLLPLLQPWRHPAVAARRAAPAIAHSDVVSPRAQLSRPLRKLPLPAPYAAPARALHLGPALLWILSLATAARLVWLFAGLWQIRNYRIRATPLYPIPEAIRAASALTHADALVCTSGEVSSPLTLGWLAPVILLPEPVLSMGDEALCGVACHELLHVRRHDWLITVFEELAGALLCFNPAVWWLLAQTRLAREQLVDAEVVQLTAAREPYIDSLLSIARAGSVLDLAPAPLFLRKRHLTQRMFSLLKEVSMSNTRLLSSYGSMAAMLAAAGWLACASFPLIGQPQTSQAVLLPGKVSAEPYGVLTGSHYRHNLSGVEFDLPAGWSLGITTKADGNARQMTVLVDPDGKTIFASAAMIPVNTPEASIPDVLSREIPHLLVRRGGVNPTHSAPNYSIREGSVEQTLIGGNQAIRAIGVNEQGGQKLVELLTWIVTEHTRAFFFARTTEADYEAIRIPYEQLVESARIP
jgi:beta-lactamase regulating signal transducer with metallopeptidase domain